MNVTRSLKLLLLSSHTCMGASDSESINQLVQRGTTPIMPISMHGQNAAFIVQGDFHDHGNQYNNIQGTGQGNCSLCLLRVSKPI